MIRFLNKSKVACCCEGEIPIHFLARNLNNGTLIALFHMIEFLSFLKNLENYKSATKI